MMTKPNHRKHTIWISFKLPDRDILAPDASLEIIDDVLMSDSWKWRQALERGLQKVITDDIGNVDGGGMGFGVVDSHMFVWRGCLREAMKRTIDYLTQNELLPFAVVKYYIGERRFDEDYQSDYPVFHTHYEYGQKMNDCPDE